MKKKISMLVMSIALTVSMTSPVLAGSFTKELPSNTWLHKNGTQSMDIKASPGDNIDWSYSYGNGASTNIPYETSNVNGKLSKDLETIGNKLIDLNKNDTDSKILIGTGSLIEKLDNKLGKTADKTNIGYVGGPLGNIGTISDTNLKPNKNGTSVWGSYGKLNFSFAGKTSTVDFDKDLETIGLDMKNLWKDYQEYINVIDRLSEKLTVAYYDSSNNTVKIGTPDGTDYIEIKDSCSQNKNGANTLSGTLDSSGVADLTFNNKTIHADFDKDIETIDYSLQDLENGYKDVKKAGNAILKSLVDYNYDNSNDKLVISIIDGSSNNVTSAALVNIDTSHGEVVATLEKISIQ